MLRVCDGELVVERLRELEAEDETAGEALLVLRALCVADAHAESRDDADALGVPLRDAPELLVADMTAVGRAEREDVSDAELHALLLDEREASRELLGLRGGDSEANEDCVPEAVALTMEDAVANAVTDCVAVVQMLLLGEADTVREDDALCEMPPEAEEVTDSDDDADVVRLVVAVSVDAAENEPVLVGALVAELAAVGVVDGDLDGHGDELAVTDAREEGVAVPQGVDVRDPAGETEGTSDGDAVDDALRQAVAVTHGEFEPEG